MAIYKRQYGYFNIGVSMKLNIIIDYFKIHIIILFLIISSGCLTDNSNKNNKKNEYIKNVTSDDIQIIISMATNSFYINNSNFNLSNENISLSNLQILVNVTIRNISDYSICISEGYKVGAGLNVKLILPSNVIINHSIYWSNALFDNMYLKSNEEIEFIFDLVSIPFSKPQQDYTYLFNTPGLHKILVYSPFLKIESNVIEFILNEK